MVSNSDNYFNFYIIVDNRIRKNLQVETNDIIQWCKARIQEKDAKIERINKSWYIFKIIAK